MTVKGKAAGNSARFIFVFLGLLTAFGPFVTDMYLPSLPVMTAYFDTSVSMVQAGLTFSMLGLVFGQLVFGPLSDAYGRRPPLLVSLVLFVAATFACIFAPTIEVFAALRLLQGIAASGGIVIARSIAADKFKRKNLAKALAVVGAINGVAPIAAPVVGGAVLDAVGWKGIFVILLLIGCVLLGFCLRFRESLSRLRRSRQKPAKSFKMFKTVLKNRRYLFYTLELAFAMAILFAYIAASPFIIQQHYGFGPFAFSLFFAANAMAIGVGAAASVRFGSPRHCLFVSCAGMTLCSLALAAVMAAGTSVVWFEVLLFALCFMMGLSFTVATALAMDAARRQAGTASAFMGASGFLSGSIVSPLAGLGNIMVSTGIILVVSALGASLFAFWAVKAEKTAAGEAVDE